MTIKIDKDRYTVHICNKPVHLTTKQFDLLCALKEAGGKVVSRPKLLQKVWGYEPKIIEEIETRAVDNEIGRLRRKLRSKRDSILTVRDRGYRYIGR